MTLPQRIDAAEDRSSRKGDAITWACGPAIVAVMMAGYAPAAQAQTLTWDAPAIGDWHDGANWVEGVEPSAGESIEILGGHATIGTGTVDTDEALIGGSGMVTLTGPTSVWDMRNLYVDGGTLAVEDGSQFSVGSVFFEAGVLGVSGAGTRFEASDGFSTGQGMGATAITVEAGGQMTTGGTFIGQGQSTVAPSIDITITGQNSVWNTDYFAIGGTDSVEASVSVSDGGTFRGATTGQIGWGGGAVVTVTGAQSQLDMGTRPLQLGVNSGLDMGQGRLIVSDGGLVTAGNLIVGSNGALSTGELTVSGTSGSRGVVEVNSLYRGSGLASVTFDGGILRARQNNSGFIANFAVGGLVIGPANFYLDSNGFVVGTNNVVTGTGALEKIGAGTLILTGNNTYSGNTVIGAGTLQLGNNGSSGSILGNVANDGVLAFNRSDTMTFGGTISGAGGVYQIGDGNTILTGNAASLSGESRVQSGTLSVNTVLGGSMAVYGGRLQGTGSVGATTNHALGTIAPGNSIGTLTIDGNYTGNGGVLEIEAVLGDDSSAADRLIVNGATSGSTDVVVINNGGLGAQTQQGIKIVEVAGASNGTFALRGNYLFEGDQAVVAGAYAYRLYQGGVTTPADGDWYLRSSLIDAGDPLYQAGAPLYESYLPALLLLNRLDTLQQRMGQRFWSSGAVAVDAQGKPGRAGTEIWGRVSASHSSMTPERSTTGASYDADIGQFQVGVDTMLHSDDAGTLFAGLSARQSNLAAVVSSVFGNGTIAGTGYGLNGSLTWYGKNGLYVDGQVGLNWYNSTLSSSVAGTLVGDTSAIGYALGLELGQQFALDGNWSVTPQLQASYSAIHQPGFTDRFGSTIAAGSASELITRLSVSLDYEHGWPGDDQLQNRLHAYGIANLYYNFGPGTQTMLSGVTLASDSAPLWAGLGLGGTYNWGGDRHALHAEASLNSSLNAAPASYALSGTLGFSTKF